MQGSLRPNEGETRRRKLDELFSDEPHLSTTMKARRLHEKCPARPPARGGPIAPASLPGAPDAGGGETWQGAGRTGPAVPDREAPDLRGTLSLEAAAGYLRGHTGPAPPDRREDLLRLRERVLRLWRVHAPPSEPTGE